MVTEKQNKNTDRETRSVIREFCRTFSGYLPHYSLTGRPKLVGGRPVSGVMCLAIVPHGCYTPSVVSEFHYSPDRRVEIQYDQQHRPVAEQLAGIVQKYNLPLFMGPFGQPPEPGNIALGGLEDRCGEREMAKILPFPARATPAPPLRPAAGYV